MRSRHELRQRIASLYVLDDRLDTVDWFHRQWMASYAADAAIIADCLLELVNNQAVLPPDDEDADTCPLCREHTKKTPRLP